MKQSLKAVCPHLDEMTGFRHFVERPFDGEKYIAHCRDDERVLLTDCYKPGHDAVILIGPEGDFSPEEVDLAVANGFRPISLGDTRLRTETAGLVACHTLHVVNMMKKNIVK